MIMLNKWDEDENSELAPLEPVVERAHSSATSFAISTFGTRIGGVASGMFRGDRLMGESEYELVT